jgi:hypothetical protein
MPIAFDTDQTRPFSLATDAPKPEASRPAFNVRFLTRRQALRYDALVADALAARADIAKFWNLVWQAIGIGVVGWHNMPLDKAELPSDAPFTRENAEAVLTGMEIMELAFGYTSAVSLSGDDRKNSPTQPSSDTEVVAVQTAEPADKAKTGDGVATTPQP